MKRYMISLGIEATRPMTEVELAFMLEHVKAAVQEAGEVIDESQDAAEVEVMVSR